MKAGGSSVSARKNAKESTIFKLQKVDVKIKELQEPSVTAVARLSKLVRANDVVLFSLVDSVYRVSYSGKNCRCCTAK